MLATLLLAADTLLMSVFAQGRAIVVEPVPSTLTLTTQHQQALSTLLPTLLGLETDNEHRHLPRGIERRLRRGRPLPPGIARQVVLPQSVNQQLALPSNVQLVVVDNTVVVVDPLTQIVVALISGLF